jgi:hypothetical protein
MRIDRDETVLSEEQHIAIGRRLRDHVAGDVAVRSGVIFDDDGLLESSDSF